MGWAVEMNLGKGGGAMSTFQAHQKALEGRLGLASFGASICCFVGLFLAALLLAMASPSLAVSENARFVPDQVIVQFKANAKASAAQDASRGIGATIHSKVSLPRTYLLELHGMSVAQAVEALNRNPQVAIAQPNYLFQITTTTPCDPYTADCDPYFGLQYALQNTGQDYGRAPAATPGADIGAARAWDLTTGSANIIVSIIDTGVDDVHEDLAANIGNPNEALTTEANDIHGWDFAGSVTHPVPDNDPRNYSNGGTLALWDHGTTVAGIVGAVGKNGKGISGVAWHVTLLPCKVAKDGEDSGSLTTCIAAIDYSIRAGARIINASWSFTVCKSSEQGCCLDPNDPNCAAGLPLLRAKIQEADEAGIIFVTGSDNQGIDIDSGYSTRVPAAYNLPNIVTVTASDATGGVALNPNVVFPPIPALGNWGATSVDLAAHLRVPRESYRSDLRADDRLWPRR